MQVCAGGLAVLAPPRIAEACGKMEKKIRNLWKNGKKIRNSVRIHPSEEVWS
jgi:hypothetical protein